MDFGTLMNVAQTLFAALHSSELKEMWSMMGYKSELDELSRTVDCVRAVLLDAEAKQEDLSHEALLWVEELKDAVYDADDLLDEFVTLAKQTKLIQGGKLCVELRKFFSRFNQLSVAYNMSQGINKIRKKLDGIANNHTKFGLSLDYKPFPCDHKLIRKRREETCSYVNSTDIIGRDADVENIVGMLLDSHHERHLSFLTIVGMGGLGKTALAQLVYNDEKVAKEFPLRLWTCVSDQDQTQFDVKTVLAQILQSATHQEYSNSSMEMVVSQLREILAGRRFLLILDDVWTENRDEWRKLVGYLMRGQRGSWVVVTTRSKETANVVGSSHLYELQGLSDENSWRLFQLVAFEQVMDQPNSNPYVDLINIGQKIVKYCANVPLAIRVVGSLLYGRDKSKWLSIQESGLANLRESHNGIKPILKLSYHNLDSPLKSCFSYCALFPKDFEIQKELLISLWIAQGLVVPLEKGQSIEDAAEEYILILLQRCFFQDVQKSISGENEIYSLKLHDLMHDVALEVSRGEICAASTFTGDVGKTVRHVSAMRGNYANYSITKAHIRTYLHFGSCKSDKVPVDIALLLANYRRLRALDLSFLNIKFLPPSIGKLIHLRHFELSSVDIEFLPESITNLFNLQTLDLFFCEKLKELPKKLSKLVNLRVLKLPYSNKLRFMPSGMGKLSGLYKLNKFVVGEGNSSLKRRADLEGLKALKNLRGIIKIVIRFPKSGQFVKCDNVKEGAYMRDKEHLYGVWFDCKHEESNGQTGCEEELLGALQPHANLKELEFAGYLGVTMPRWAKEDNLASFLPNLVSLSFFQCLELQYLPSLEKMRQLKSLHLSELPNLEYIENHPARGSLQVLNGEGTSLLPCLEMLYLCELPKLKGWWTRSLKGLLDKTINSGIATQPPSHVSLLRLKKLEISECPELTSLPYCPNVEKLNLFNFNGQLQIIANKDSHELIGEAVSSTSYPSTSYPKLRKVYTDNLAWMHSSLPVEAFQSLSSLLINGDKEVESLTEWEQVFRVCSSSLKSLRLIGCPKLRCLSGGLMFLTHLESLYLGRLPIVSLADEIIDGDGEDDVMPWGSLCDSLQNLEISECKELKSFPRWFRKLNSLSHLVVSDCSASLYERCQSYTGEDWPNVRHVPNLSIK
ncbi:hypothetical protein RND81_14G129200 [Saponaria officinalis]|uniref:Uncharacterized protein n=1 Tax=Saponaria officinalis TaxID=3572 RepID=A0AAW1GMI3_SAPOF